MKYNNLTQNKFAIVPKQPHSRTSNFRTAKLLAAGILLVGTAALIGYGCTRAEKKDPKKMLYPTVQAYQDARAEARDSLENALGMGKEALKIVTSMVDALSRDPLFRFRQLTEADVVSTLDSNFRLIGDDVSLATLDNLFRQHLRFLRDERENDSLVSESDYVNASRGQKQREKEEYSEKVNQVMRVWTLLSYYKELPQSERSLLYGYICSTKQQ